MLGLLTESQSILVRLAQHSDYTGPLASRNPAEAQFLYELTDSALDGVDRVDEDSLKTLEREFARNIPYFANVVDIDNEERRVTKIEGMVRHREGETGNERKTCLIMEFL